MYLLFNDNYGNVAMVQKSTHEECVEAAGSLDLSEGQFAIFDNLDNLPDGWQDYPTGVTLTLGSNFSYGYDFSKTKQVAEVLINNQSNEAAALNLANLSYYTYVAQCSLPADQRIAKYQAAIDANNALAAETENREQAVYAASTIQEVNAIVYPPQD